MTKAKAIICPTCNQDMKDEPRPGFEGKDCPQCGQGMPAPSETECSDCRYSSQDTGFVTLCDRHVSVNKLIELLAYAQVYYCNENCWSTGHCDTCKAMDAFTKVNSSGKG